MRGSSGLARTDRRAHGIHGAALEKLVAQGFPDKPCRAIRASASQTFGAGGRFRNFITMRTATTLAELRSTLDALRAFGQGGAATGALVPTMGALHAGHEALLDAARKAADFVVTSIFVNPLQFEHQADLARYPRDAAGDLATLADSGCDLAWMPDVATMYPPGNATVIDVAGPALGWEGDARPGHFRGVATVVAKLFAQIRPDVALFGEKDWQQLQVVRRMAADLCMPVRIEAVQTLREADGLAMSSRNRFLGAAERETAPLLFASLTDLACVLARGAPAEAAIAASRATLAEAGFDIEYLALVDGASLLPARYPVSSTRLIAAARLGSVRLLDNIAAHQPGC